MSNNLNIVTCVMYASLIIIQLLCLSTCMAVSAHTDSLQLYVGMHSYINRLLSLYIQLSIDCTDLFVAVLFSFACDGVCLKVLSLGGFCVGLSHLSPVCVHSYITLHYNVASSVQFIVYSLWLDTYIAILTLHLYSDD